MVAEPDRLRDFGQRDGVDHALSQVGQLAFGDCVPVEDDVGDPDRLSTEIRPGGFLPQAGGCTPIGGGVLGGGKFGAGILGGG